MHIILVCSIFMFLITVFGPKDKVSRFRNVKKIDINILENYKKEKRYMVNTRIERITQKEQALYKRIINKFLILLFSRYNNMALNKYIAVLIIAVIGGYFIGMNLLNNIFIGILLAITDLWIAYICLEEYVKRKTREKDQKLLIVLSNLTSAYISGDNFISAVEETIESIPEPLYDMFLIFLYKMKYYGFDNIEEAMVALASEVDNFYFTEFVHLIIQAENGETGLKYTIETLPEDYSTYIKINEDYRKVVAEINLQFLLRILLLPITIGFTYFIGKEYFYILTNHFVGKSVLFIIFLAYVIAIYIFRKNNKEVEMEI